MRVLLRCVAVTVAALTACTTGHVGREFDNEKSLTTAFGDCVAVGRFDVTYPARVIGVESSDGTLRFLHRDTPHTYAFPEGVEMRAVFVEHRGGKGVVVLRGNPQT